MLVTAGVVVVLAVGGVAWARSGSTPSYRTVVVTRGAVTAGLDLVGSIQPAQAATVGFAQPGTVATVDVAVGQQVTAGQVVARLDLTTLRGKLASARATEAAARLAYTQAENGQLPAGSAGAAGGGASGSSRTTSGSSPGGGSGSTAAQQAVTTAQKAVQAAQDAARQQLTAASAACGAPEPAATGAAGGSASPASSRARSSSPGAGTAGGTAAGSGPGTGGATAPSSDCLAAESALLQAEDAVSKAQATLTTAQTVLSKALAGGASGTGAATTTVTDAQLAQYRSALEAATAAAGVAQQALDQGTAISPLTGTVVSVGLVPGQAVPAASSTAVVEVAAAGGYQVTTTVPTARVGQVAQGQHATVTPDGGGALEATVSSVGVAPSSSGYPVVLALPATAGGLHVGSSAAVALTTGSVPDAVVVPTSAVRTVGSRHLVEVLTGSTVSPVAVTTGATGPLRTQVLSGLQVGQRVVLADLSATVTSDSSTTGGGAFGGGSGRFAGAGGVGTRTGSRPGG